DRAGGEHGDERGARYRDRQLVSGGANADGAQPSRGLADRRQDIRGGRSHRIDVHHRAFEQQVYDIGKNTWAAVLGMPTPRSGVGTAVLNGRMHVLGGEAYLNGRVGTYRTHEACDPKTSSWHGLPPMPTPRHGLAVAEIGGKMYAVSGSNVAGGGGPHEGVNVNEVYDPN